MGSTILRPNAATNIGWTGSNAEIAAWLADNLDSTFTRSTAAAQALTVDFTTASFPVLAQIRHVTPRIRLRADGTTQADRTLPVQVGVDVGGGSTITHPATSFVPSATMNTLVGQTHTTAPSGSGGSGEWTQAHIDKLRVAFRRPDGVTAGTTIDVAELYLFVEYNEAPVVVVTAPTSATTPTARPTVAWTYSDPEGDPAELTEVKVFSAAQYTAAGFSPTTSTPVWVAPPMYGAPASVTVATDLVNGTTYRAYVRARDAGSGGRFGAWAFSQFTLSITPPPTPGFTATADSVLNRFTLVITPGSGTPAAQFFDVERSVDGGTTWTTIRGGILAATGSPITLYDYEAPRMTAVRYRAKSRAVVGGNTVVSPWVTTAGVTIGSDNKWWLKDPLSSALNSSIKAAPPFKYRPFREHVEVEDMLGRADPVAVSDGRKLGAGTLAVWLHSRSEYDALLALLRTGHVLFLQSTLAGMEWYVRFEEPDLSLLHHSDAPNPGIAHHHRLELNWWEMAAPGVDLEPVRVTAPGGGDTFTDTF